MKVLLDMNLSPDWPDLLGTAGIEAVHWAAVGKPDAADEAIMRHAEEFGYVVLTEDLDFGILLARNRWKRPSVVQIRLGKTLPRQVGERVVAALRSAESLLDEGAFVSIDPKRNRVSALPRL